jgi:hypothetical protein
LVFKHTNDNNPVEQERTTQGTHKKGTMTTERITKKLNTKRNHLHPEKKGSDVHQETKVSQIAHQKNNKARSLHTKYQKKEKKQSLNMNSK